MNYNNPEYVKSEDPLSKLIRKLRPEQEYAKLNRETEKQHMLNQKREKKGKGIPTTGKIPIHIETLITTCQKRKAAIPIARRE